MPNQYSHTALHLLFDDLKTFGGGGQATDDRLDILAKKLAVSEPAGFINLVYRFEQFDIIPEVEKAAISHVESADRKELNLQVHLPPAPIIIYADRLFIQPLLHKLLFNIVAGIAEGTALNIYVTHSDEKCVVECISKGTMISRQASDDYFKKYRITNPLHASVTNTDDVLPVYKQVIADMGGELVYAFSKEKDNYFRLKFALV